jgi:hypothetical protein
MTPDLPCSPHAQHRLRTGQSWQCPPTRGGNTPSSTALRIAPCRSGPRPPSNLTWITLYVCGITPYDTTHLGHARTFLLFDLLIRHLEAAGRRARYVQNVRTSTSRS